MASKHVISMSIVLNFFKEQMKQFERGENAYSSGHVVDFHFEGDLHPAILKGKVEASMKNKKYDVEISVDLNQGTITDVKCSCPRGQVVCHHMAALCIFAYHNVSSTDKACVWNVRGPSSKHEEVKKLSDIYPPSKPNYQPVDRLASEEEIASFKKDLAGNIVGFSWLLQPEPSREVFIIPQIEDILMSSEYLEASDKIAYFIEKNSVNETMRNSVIAATTGQATNPNWLLARKYRLTASKFGVVLSACRRGRFSAAFYKNLLEGYDLGGGVKAVQWGIQHEKTAIEAFTLATGISVEGTGFWLHPCGFLGASPDGLANDHLVEVKCPFKFRNSGLEEAVTQSRQYIIFRNENGETEVNKSHHYFHQIQGQLYITGKNICYLIVWTPQETHIVEVEKDSEWAPNVDVLKNFYLNNFIPFILDNN